MIKIVFGDDKTIFKNFIIETEEEKIAFKNSECKVKLTFTLFADEWDDLVDYNKSYAYLENGKLILNIYGIPDFINPVIVEEYARRVMNQYLKQGYGELFTLIKYCPLCVIVDYNDKEVIV
jgi:hypothetical protein